MPSALATAEALEADVLCQLAGALAAGGGLSASVRSAPGCLAVVDAVGAYPAVELRRVVGLGLTDRPTAAEVDACLRASRGRPAVDVVDPTPGAEALRDLLAERGYQPSRQTLVLTRRVDGNDAEPSPSEAVSVRPAAEADLPAVEVLYAETFGCSDGVRLVGRPGWHWLVAEHGGQLVAAAALYARGPVAWLGWGATAAAARGRGAHSALIAARLGLAARLGATAAAMNVWQTDPPGPAWRNARRAGFALLAARTRWDPPADGADEGPSTVA